MNPLLKKMLKEIDDENTSLAADRVGSSEFSGTIDTGSYIFNAALSGSLYGGIPNNKIIALAGEESTGKTFFSLGIVNHFLNANPDAFVLYFDSEAAVTVDMLEERGIDSNRVAVSEPESVQKFRHNAIKALDAYMEEKEENRYPFLMVLDSMGQLSTTKELEDTAEGKETRDMTRAQVLRATFRVLSLKLAKAKVPLIVTNHTYDVVGSYFPTKEMSGGGGLKYSASQIVYLSKKKDKDGKDVIGNIIRCTVVKSRFTKENKVVEVKLNYDTGLDRYYGLLDLADKHDVIKKISTRYELPNGSKVFGKYINEHPEEVFDETLMSQLEEIAKKEFCYGNGNHEEELELVEDESD